MLAVRIVTAIVLLAILLPVLFGASPLWTASIALVFTMVACREWVRLLAFGEVAAIAFALSFGLIAAFAGSQLPTRAVVVPSMLATVFWAFAAPTWLATGLPATSGATRALLAAIGVLALGAAWWSLVVAVALGPMFLLSILGIVWVSDIAAYFAGRAFGRHKLAPRISPGKTWEGAAGALIVTLGLALLVAARDGGRASDFVSQVFARLPVAAALAAIAALVVLGIVGDLFESLLKRRAGVKDSGGVLPGHGGVLDRIDAMIPVLPAAILLHAWALAR